MDKKTFTEEAMPLWPCPTCGIGQLKIEKNKILHYQNASTQRKNSEFISQFLDDDISHFAGLLNCSNQQCNEVVAFSGIHSYEYTVNRNGDNHYYLESIFPKFFFPSLKIISVSDNWPKSIGKQIEKSFSHFFNDESACANSIRTSIEMLMDELKINKTTTNKNKQRRNLKLHDRIEIFGKQHPEIKPYIMAAKWIGNSGSHMTDLTRENLLDGYELLEYSLYELYDKKQKQKDLNKKAKLINTRKKPVNVKSK